MQRLSNVGLMALLGGAVLIGQIAGAPARAADDKGGTVKGHVVWAGANVPEQKPLNVIKDQQACLAKGPILDESVVVNKDNKGMANVFVWITSSTGGKPPVPASMAKPEKKEVELDQPTCAFEPHALAMREGQTLVAKNTAPVAHNVSWSGNLVKNPGGNKIVPSGGKLDITNLKADNKQAVSVTCTIHGWMKGWVRVYDHPYFAVTDKDGKFEFPAPPPGSYKIWYWSDSGWKDGAAGSSGFPIAIKPGTNDLDKVEWKPAK
jgi:hypothetical protein